MASSSIALEVIEKKFSMNFEEVLCDLFSVSEQTKTLCLDLNLLMRKSCDTVV